MAGLDGAVEAECVCGESCSDKKRAAIERGREKITVDDVDRCASERVRGRVGDQDGVGDPRAVMWEDEARRSGSATWNMRGGGGRREARRGRAGPGLGYSREGSEACGRSSRMPHLAIRRPPRRASAAGEGACPEAVNAASVFRGQVRIPRRDSSPAFPIWGLAVIDRRRHLPYAATIALPCARTSAEHCIVHHQSPASPCRVSAPLITVSRRLCSLTR